VTRWLRLSVELLRRLHPALAAWWVERLFFTPPHARSRRIEDFVASGEPFLVPFGGRRLAAWRWGSGPTVLLVHGWGGLGGQLSELVIPLVASGFSVVTFDAPGHGRSGRGLSSLVDFARAIEAIARETGPFAAAVTHSLGGAAVAFALHRGFRLPRAVFISPPARPADWAELFAERFGVTGDVMSLMRRRAEKRLGVSWSDLDVPSFAGGLTTELLVVHDRDDAEVRWSDGAQLARAWPGAQLFTTSGLGHRRILRSPEVVTRVVAFVTEGVAPTAEATELEADLLGPAR
jgi:pimeloyl-ACP methyl ester carboxylesterase